MTEEKEKKEEINEGEHEEEAKIIRIPIYRAPRKPNHPTAGFYTAQRGIPKPQLDRIEVFLQAHGSSSTSGGSSSFDLKRANEFREFFRGPQLDEVKLDEFLKQQQQQQQVLTYDKFIDMFKNVFNLNDNEEDVDEKEKNSTS